MTKLSFLLLTVLVAVIVAPAGRATPLHNHGLTIAVTPNPILAGEGVLIYGQLKAKPVGSQTIVLYHHVVGRPGYTVIGKTTTNAAGFYEFTRAESVVVSNRSWYVRAPGAKAVHSRKVHERVAALVSLAASTAAGETGQPVVFSGNVSPDHNGETVLLQQQVGTGATGWKMLASAVIGGGSDYTIPYRFRIPGAHDLRVRFPGDRRDIAALSDTVTVTIQQTQNPSFTINSSAPVLDEGSPATISGNLYLPGTTTPKAGVSVTLLGREAPFAPGNEFAPVTAPVITGADGSYSFSVTPVHNVEYEVQTTAAAITHRHTAILFEGVRDLVTIAPSSATATVSGTVTISGTVAPNATGHTISLQRQGADGNWHEVELGVVAVGSTYSLTDTFDQAGTINLRARIFGGPENLGAPSPVVAIAVSGLAPVTSLPPAS